MVLFKKSQIHAQSLSQEFYAPRFSRENDRRCQGARVQMLMGEVPAAAEQNWDEERRHLSTKVGCEGCKTWTQVDVSE